MIKNSLNLDGFCHRGCLIYPGAVYIIEAVSFPLQNVYKKAYGDDNASLESFNL